MRRVGILVVSFIIFLNLSGFARTIYWFTGAGIKKPAEKIARMFEKGHNCNVVIITGGSGQVLNEMLRTRRGDIYTLVDYMFLKRALKKGIVIRYKKILKLTPIFLISKKAEDKIHSLYDLAKGGVKIAGGNPKAMCLGVTFDEILSKIPKNLRDRIEKNVVVKCLNVFQIVGYVKSGVVDAGIVLDKALVKDVGLKWINIPPRYNVHRYGYVALIRYSKNKKLASKLYDFILEHLYVYKQYGFSIVR